MKPFIAQIRSNLRLMIRDRAVLFYSYLFPLTFFFGFGQVFHASASPGAMSYVIAMVLIIGVLSNGFFGAGIRTVSERETNVLRRFKVAPISAAPIIVASMISGLVAYLPTVVVFLTLGKLVYHAPLPADLFSLFLFISLGLLSFRALGMIIASVVNSQQEATIVVQLLYLPMLFLSGATFPTSIMPRWVQNAAHFLPATYLFEGLRSIMVQGESIFSDANLKSSLALIVTMAVALFVGVKLFRWEKEEKISPKAKLWIVAVLLPFFIDGAYQTYSQQNASRNKLIDRESARRRSVLFQHINIFVGDGSTINDGAVLIKNGVITQVFPATPSNPESYLADVVDSSGKTMIPGLVDMHVHIGAPGGLYSDGAKYGDSNLVARRLAAYLYSGITTVRSLGDQLDPTLQLRAEVSSGKRQGAHLFTCGPLFTAPGGHPEEIVKQVPQFMRQTFAAQFLRQPTSTAQARQQVDDLKRAGVDCVKAVLEAGSPVWQQFTRFDSALYNATIDQAQKDGLPTATHTGSAEDVKAAVEAGSNTVEHGSGIDRIPAEVFAEMKRKNIAYDPTLSMFEGLTRNPELLNRSLLQQVGPADLLSFTKSSLLENPGNSQSNAAMAGLVKQSAENLLAAYRAGVTLIAGSDAGNFLVIHGPTIQHELELWTAAGIPPAVALQAATGNAAKVLGEASHFGQIKPNLEATFVILDGDPQRDIVNAEHINAVYLRGEHIDRTDLFDDFKP